MQARELWPGQCSVPGFRVPPRGGTLPSVAGVVRNVALTLGSGFAVNFEALIITMSVLGGSLILGVTVACCCCCRRKRSRKPDKRDERAMREQEERRVRQEER